MGVKRICLVLSLVVGMLLFGATACFAADEMPSCVNTYERGLTPSVEEIVQILKESEEFLRAFDNGEVDADTVDFRRAYFCGADLSGRNLIGTDLRYSFMQWSNMSGASLDKVNLKGASLRNADLSGASLSEVDLSGAMLDEVNLSGASLRKIDLSEASLNGADLSGAMLDEVNLSGVSLRKADLSENNLSGADLSGVDLSESNLSGAGLSGVDLREANLSGADLSGADLSGATLIGTTLIGATLNGASLFGANLIGATLNGANLFGATLIGANLLGANLSGADLSEADLSQADLTIASLGRTTIFRTKLTGAVFSGINLTEARYEPISTPAKGTLAGIKGLSTVSFDNTQQTGLVLLRATLKEVGLRELEREATYALEYNKAQYSRPVECWFRTIFFDWTSKYGLEPARPLKILLCLIFVFLPFYVFPIAGYGKRGIYKVFPDGLLKAPRKGCMRRGGPVSGSERLALKWYKAIGYALYFSLLSAFHVGWRELNVGNWITRMQPEEFLLKPTGWIRTVSGLQSVISVYLLALSVLTYFGRPFG